MRVCQRRQRNPAVMYLAVTLQKIRSSHSQTCAYPPGGNAATPWIAYLGPLIASLEEGRSYGTAPTKIPLLSSYSESSASAFTLIIHRSWSSPISPSFMVFSG